MLRAVPGYNFHSIDLVTGYMELLACKLGLLRRLLPLAVVLMLVASPGCGGPSGRAPVPGPPGPQNDAPGQTTDDAAAPTPRNVLSTALPALAGLPPGAEIEFTVSADCADGLYQGSGRVVYDPAALQPVAAVRGTALPGGCLFVAKLDAPAIATPGLAGLPANSGVVPYAFTLLPGASNPAIPPGELLRIRFRLLRQPGGNGAQLLNTAEYLQLRNAQGARLAFSLDARVGP